MTSDKRAYGENVPIDYSLEGRNCIMIVVKEGLSATKWGMLYSGVHMADGLPKRENIEY